jgi:DNA polymerase (family 10)
MGGVALGGRRVSLNVAQGIAQEILIKINPAIQQAIVCGSIRRERPTVGDVDLVVIGNEKFDALLVELCGVQKNGKPARKFLYDGVQIEFYPATLEDFGAQRLMWTGSKEFNIRCRKAAQKKGILLNQYGAWIDNNIDESPKRIAGATEEEVLKAIGIDYLNPEDRE